MTKKGRFLFFLVFSFLFVFFFLPFVSNYFKVYIGFSQKKEEIREMLELMTAIAIVYALLLLPQYPVKAAEKPAPTLSYTIIGKNNNGPPSSTSHPPLVNDPSRGCSAGNYCRHFALSVQNPSGTRVEAVVMVEAGAPVNRSEPGTEAIAAGIAAWSLNKTYDSAYGRLSVSMDGDGDDDSAQMLQLQAVSRGIVNMGLAVQYRSASMSTGDVASLSLVDGSIAITVDTASNRVGLKFFTHVEESLGETDIIHILEYAKAKLLSIPK